VQSLPFIAAVAIALIEGTRFNSLAYWQALETRTRELLPRTKTITIAEPAKLTAEKIEAAQ
jgi:hypothetical protein